MKMRGLVVSAYNASSRADVQLLPIEAAVLRVAGGLIKLVGGTAEPEAAGAVQPALSGVLDKVKAGGSSRWESLYGFTLLAMLSRMLEATTKQTQQSAKPKKGQKTPQGVADAVAALKAARDDLQSATSGLITAFEKSQQADQALTVNDCPFEDEEFKAKIVNEVLGARSNAISNARRLIGGSKR